MYVEQKWRNGRCTRIWVGKTPAVVISRGIRQVFVLRPRLTKALSLRVGTKVAVDMLAEGSILLKKRDNKSAH
jgi:hypothetical protein